MTREEKIEKIKTKFASQLVDYENTTKDFYKVLNMVPEDCLDAVFNINESEFLWFFIGFLLWRISGMNQFKANEDWLSSYMP